MRVKHRALLFVLCPCSMRKSGDPCNLTFEEIKKTHTPRFPFIMIDRFWRSKPGKHAIAVKNISGNDMVFLGHFPEKAVMPGALIIEPWRRPRSSFLQQVVKRKR